MEKQVDRDGTAQHFGKIARPDGKFAHKPVGPPRPLWIPIAAALSEVLSSHNAQSGGKDLKKYGHRTGHSNDPEQAVLEGAPPERSVPQFPGSMYPTLISKAGPT